MCNASASVSVSLFVDSFQPFDVQYNRAFDFGRGHLLDSRAPLWQQTIDILNDSVNEDNKLEWHSVERIPAPRLLNPQNAKYNRSVKRSQCIAEYRQATNIYTGLSVVEYRDHNPNPNPKP